MQGANRYRPVDHEGSITDLHDASLPQVVQLSITQDRPNPGVNGDPPACAPRPVQPEGPPEQPPARSDYCVNILGHGVVGGTIGIVIAAATLGTTAAFAGFGVGGLLVGSAVGAYRAYAQGIEPGHGAEPVAVP